MTDINKVKNWLDLFADKVSKNKEHLNQLDSDIGDGDHGSNMNRGVLAVKEKTESTNYDSLKDLFKDIGMSLVSKVGGASGPLYGSAFISMAKEVDHSEDIGLLITEGLNGIVKRGKAEPGEKTLVDMWTPVAEALKNGSLDQSVITEALANTKDMKATKGRASYLGDRSIGHVDPGAQSSAYLFEALLEAGVLDE